MKNMVKKIDLLFIFCLTTAFLYLSVFIFTYPYLYDESCYATIPYRFITGDSIIQHEWHLTQFASFFTYIPVKLWLSIKGSSDGIIVFLRCIYLCIHTSVAIVIYRFFKEEKIWAIITAMIFYTQTAYRVLALSYHSVYVVFLILLTFCLFSIYKKANIALYVSSGICYACCCICNPFFCAMFPIYLLFCALWTKREKFRQTAINIKTSFIALKTNQPKKNKKKNKKNTKIDAFPEMENYSCFFNKQAMIFSAVGLLTVIIAFFIFFIFLGGTFPSILNNFNNILQSTEHRAVSFTIFNKIKDTLYYFNRISFNMPFILPILYAVMFFDRNRKDNTHRLLYIASSVILAVMYIFGLVNNAFSFASQIFPLPLAIISFTCYVLTKNKNKKLFYCIWLPALIGTIFQYLAANTHLSAIGIVLTVNNIAGIFFIKDLFIEMQCKKDTKLIEKHSGYARILLCIAICIQLSFNIFVFQYDQIPEKNAIKASDGPFSGIYMSSAQYEHYYNAISDLDFIKENSKKSDPVLIVSYQNWMYLYTERPISTYATWYPNQLEGEALISYYKANPDKTPKYIYIDSTGYHFNNEGTNDDINWNTLDEMFEYTKTKLSDGTLLTVTRTKFN